MKTAIALAALFLAGCATNNNEDYQRYLDQNTRVQQAINAAEAACLLVLAEAIKTADPVSKAAIAIQIDKCRKEQTKIEPPKRGILGIFN